MTWSGPRNREFRCAPFWQVRCENSVLYEGTDEQLARRIFDHMRSHPDGHTPALYRADAWEHTE